MRDRILAAVGAILIATSLVIIWAARSTVSRDLYVSELGAAGEPTEHWFEAALLLIVGGSALIAAAARDIRSRPAILRAWTPAVTLWFSGLCFLIASQVNCTAGCPLPVGSSFTWQDFIHTLVAVLAFAAACWAMLQCSFAVGHPALRRFSLASAVSVALIAGAGGLMSLLRWNAEFGSRLELVATTIGLVWILTLGLSRVGARGAGAVQAERERTAGADDTDRAESLRQPAG